MKPVGFCTEEAHPQVRFEETYRFTSACVHCGKPMGGMTMDRYESTGPGRVKQRDVIKVWIDPQHDCTYLSIDATDKAISA